MQSVLLPLTAQCGCRTPYLSGSAFVVVSRPPRLRYTLPKSLEVRAMAAESSNKPELMSGATEEAPQKLASTDKLRQLSNEELGKELGALRASLFKIHIKKASRKEYKPHLYLQYRKQIARVLTILREREIVQGINKRDSRRMQKQKMMALGFPGL